MADVIGRTVIEVGADASGFSKELSSQTNAAADTAGTQFSSKFSNKVKLGGVAAAAGLVGILGTALGKGFNKLRAIENAESKLSGLGHSAKAVTKIMDSATTAVTGTAFGLGDAAGQAATLVSSGIKPGKELTKTMQVMADSANIAETSLGEMGSIFGKVAANGTLTGEALAQMSDRGVSVIGFLAESMGKPQAAIKKMVSEGKISFKEFETAMDKGIGGSAQGAGKTFDGAMANIGNSLGSLGADVLKPVFEQLPALMLGLIESIKSMGPVLEDIGVSFGEIFTAVQPVLGVIAGAIGAIVGKLAEWAAAIASNSAAMKTIVVIVSTVLVPWLIILAAKYTLVKVKAIASWVAQQAAMMKSAAKMAIHIGEIIILLAKLGWAYAKNAARAVAAAAVKAGVWVGEAAKATAAGAKMAIVFAAQKARWVASGVVALAGAAVNAGAWLLMSASAIASGIASGIAFVAQKVGWVTSAATAMASAVVIAAAWLIALGPIGLIIAAIALVIAIFVGLWLKFEGFRNFWIGLWEMILEVFGAVWDAIKKAFELALSFIMAYIKAWIAVFLAVWDGIKKVWTFVKGIFDKIKAVIKTVVDWITEKVTQFIVGIIRTWMRIKELWNRARFIFEKIKKMIAIWVLRIKQKIKDFVQGIVDKVVGIKDKLIEGGKNLIKGLWDGIKSMGSWIKDKVLGFLKNMIPGPLKGFLGLDDEGGGDDVSASSNTGGGTVKSLSIPGQRAYGGSTTTDQSVSAKIYVTTPAADPKIVAEQVFDRAAQLARV